MLRLFLILPFLFSFITAQVWKLSDTDSTVKFKIKNLGVQVTGSFTGLTGKVNFDSTNPGASHFEASVNVSTINTGIDLRDEHLRSDDYFDAKNHPRIRFVSSRIAAGKKSNSYTMWGNLTVRETTREISFPFSVESKDGGYRFIGEFKINRRDYKVGGSSFTLSDNLTVYLDVFAPKG
ncbi:MAG: YceI family protein [Chitinophagaceae bacterium]|nr:YceI family protein [Chitinophagaceae bacterium]